MRLSILIPTIKRDEIFYNKLLSELRRQTFGLGIVEVLSESSESESIGTKRNKLLERATGEYLCFIDADDDISDDYIEQQILVVNSGRDCGSLRGIYSVDGLNDGIFEHSLKYNEWKTTKNEVKYERFPNHLNAIKSSIAKQFKFTDKNHGEDYDWSTILHKSGLLKTEYYIPQVLYFYNYRSNK